MGVIVIKADKKSNKLLSELAHRLGASVFNLEDDLYEEIALGKLMDSGKTGELVNLDTILLKLSKK